MRHQLVISIQLDIEDIIMMLTISLFYEMFRPRYASGGTSDLTIALNELPEHLTKSALKLGSSWRLKLTGGGSLGLSNKYVSDELDEWWAYPY